MKETIVNKIYSIVSMYPDTCAVIDNGKKYSYKNIWKLSGLVAEKLLSSEVDHDTIIGLEYEKSAEYIASIIGVWRAGVAFAPLSKKHPRARQKRACQLANIEIVLSTIIHKDEIEDIELSDTESELAYVFFTSGSSGEPKAVAVTHKGIIALVESQIPSFDLSVGKRSLLYLDIVFDASLSDILTSLCSGATLVIESGLGDIRHLINILDQRRITTFDIPPSLLALLDINSMPDCLETLIVGGEPSSPDLLCVWAQKFKVVSVYGPTEATICSSLQLIDPFDWKYPLLGQPIQGTFFSVRDEDANTTNLAGELWIGGLGVACGYLGAPNLTKQKFVIKNNIRWFRTGDLVRKDGDDYIFLGRIDRQIKVRGKLVSPEEVEACLLQLPSVNQAVVTLQKNVLIAYLQGIEINIEKHLRNNLPVWMRPVKVYWVETLPRLDSGKVNFSALPEIQQQSSSSTNENLTDALLILFKEVLAVSSVGLDDNFFDLGGDSIAVMSLIIKIESYGYRLSVEDIYSNPTVRALANEMPLPDSRECTELNSDINWKPRFELPAVKYKTDIDNILITGATGFLGIQVVFQIIKQTKANIHCLVRGSSNEEASERFFSTLNSRSIVLDTSRIFVYAGDIEKSQLGLDENLYNELGYLVDTVVHCAAKVNMVSNYDVLYRSNVLGTRHLLDFSAYKRIKKFWYASTLSVFVSADPLPQVCLETDDLNYSERVYGGYAQSKWVAEKMVREASAYLPNISITRLGLLVGDQLTCALPDNDLLSFFIRIIDKLKSIPREIASLTMDLTPVDYAAAAMVNASINNAKTIHVANPLAVSGQMLIDAFECLDTSIAIVTKEKWLQSLSLIDDNHEQTAVILGLNRAFKLDNKDLKNIDIFAATDTTFDLTELKKIVSSVDCICPKISIKTLKKMIVRVLDQDRGNTI